MGKRGPKVGTKQSPETIAKRVAKNTGKKRNKIQRENISKGLKGKYIGIYRGQNAHAWKGGRRDKKYCHKFNFEFKERVRSFFDYRCVHCGMSQEENGKALHVHHVDYNKQTCCDESKPMFVALCTNCHLRTNHDRSVWKEHFKKIIIEEYGGKSYFPK